MGKLGVWLVYRPENGGEEKERGLQSFKPTRQGNVKADRDRWEHGGRSGTEQQRNQGRKEKQILNSLKTELHLICIIIQTFAKLN